LGILRSRHGKRQGIPIFKAGAFCRGGYYQLRQLRPLKRWITCETIKTLKYAFIGSRSDCCNVHRRWTLEPSAFSPERRSSPRYRFRTAGTNNTCTAAASLPAGSSTCAVQADDVGTPFGCSNCTGLPVLTVRRVSPHFICWSALSALS